MAKQGKATANRSAEFATTSEEYRGRLSDAAIHICRTWAGGRYGFTHKAAIKLLKESVTKWHAYLQRGKKGPTPGDCFERIRKLPEELILAFDPKELDALTMEMWLRFVEEVEAGEDSA